MKRFGEVLRIGGKMIMLFSYFILFFVIEPIVGMERIVGKDFVIREKDGGFLYSNPLAVWFWVAVIVAFGFIVNWIGWSLLRKQSQKES